MHFALWAGLVDYTFNKKVSFLVTLLIISSFSFLCESKLQAAKTALRKNATSDNKAPSTNFSDAKIKATQAKNGPLIEKYTKKETFDGLIAKGDKYSSDEFINKILDAPERKKEKMRAFRDTLQGSIKLPIPKDFFGQDIALGLYTKDLLKLLFYGVMLIDEKLLLNCYLETISTQLTTHLIAHQQTATTALSEHPLSEESFQSLTPDTLKTSLSHIQQLIKTSSFKGHIWHTLLGLAVEGLKSHYLLNEDNHQTLKTLVDSGKPLPIFSLVQETVLLDIPLDMHSETIIHQGIHILKHYNIIDGTCDKTFLQLSKNLIVSLLFLNSMTSLTILPRWKKFLENSHNQIAGLLTNYHNQPKDRPEEEKQKSQQEIKKLLHDFIQEGISVSYWEWIKEKNRYTTRMDIFYYSIFLIPVAYRTGKMIYQFYKDLPESTSQRSAS